jgi:ATP-dependent helicase/nuclease subunit A
MEIGHQIIMASAGTGKTFALTGRLIRLLALGVPLERIVALTFTRAAAGEMFDTLVTRLAAAAGDAAVAAREAGEHLGLPGLERQDFTRLLRQVTSRMHLSPIGTLDAFFVRVVRLFPFEFGLTGEFSLIQGQALTLEKQRVLRAILRTPQDGGDGEARARFIEAFKRATFGAEEKRLHAVLESFVSAYHGYYLSAADPQCWGDAACIWPAAAPWWRELPEAELGQAVDAFRRALLACEPTDVQRERWEAFLAQAAAFAPGSVINKPGDDVFGKLLDAQAELACGAATITVMRRRFELSPDLCALARKLAGHVVACVIQSRLESTRGVRDILARYERVYDATVRRSGRLAFADVTHLMTQGALGEARLGVDYRLDGRYDHWAIDEFQDTSRAQWAGIEPLLDEVIQDPEGRRTFFAVGDVKQAIYGWRGGDSRLLGEIAALYGIERIPLNDSYRCGPAVIEAVNRVFSRLSESRLPAAAAARWGEVWETHRSARPKLTGVAVLNEVRPAEPGARVAQADWFADIGELLERQTPWLRGLSTGVLVRSNPQGAALTESLRERGIPAVWTGDKAIADNPAVAAILDLFRFAEHPGDNAAWQHLLMTPLRQCFGTGPEPAADRVSLEVLTSLSESGFAATLEHWLMRLQAVCEIDPFSRQRLRALLDAAEAFDRTGSRSCLEFIDFVEEYTVSDLAAAGTVHVMTIHRSKGLGFDLAVLPLFSGRTGLDGVQAGEVISGRSAGTAAGQEWLLLAPPTAVAGADPVLREAIAVAAVDGAFEELCVLYVGMTRARYALHLLVPPPPKDEAGSVHLHTVVRHLLATAPAPAAAGGLACLGEPAWFEAFPRRDPGSGAASTVVSALPSLASAPAARRHRRSTPSTHDEGRSAGELFVPGRRRGLAFGTALHGFLEQIEWFGDASPELLATRWRTTAGVPDDLAAAVLKTALKALSAPEVQRSLSRPPGVCELWRERSFDMILDDEWISGTFDRVVLRWDAQGRLVGATILDYKSDRVQTEDELGLAAQRYAPQMALYRRALSRLAGLPPAAIEARLVFTHAGRVVKASPRTAAADG